MVNRKWAYRELFDSEEEAARAYDDAVWRLKPKEAKSYINFKERYSGERAPGGRLHRPRQLSSLRCFKASARDYTLWDTCTATSLFAMQHVAPADWFHIIRSGFLSVPHQDAEGDRPVMVQDHTQQQRLEQDQRLAVPQRQLWAAPGAATSLAHVRRRHGPHAARIRPGVQNFPHRHAGSAWGSSLSGVGLASMAK